MILWGEGHGNQRCAPIELLRWYGLGEGRGSSEPVRIGPQVLRLRNLKKLPRTICLRVEGPSLYGPCGPRDNCGWITKHLFSIFVDGTSPGVLL